MSKLPPSALILKRVQEFLAKQGFDADTTAKADPLRESILPTLAASRSTQSALYSWEAPQQAGVVRGIKNKILYKAKNVIVGVLERLVMRQQKYNEVVYQAITTLAAENAALRAELDELQSKPV